jgi:hypothetical protein
MVRMITLLAAFAAMTIAAIMPVSCFLAAQARVRGEVEINAELYARRSRRKRDKIPRSGTPSLTVRQMKHWTTWGSAARWFRMHRTPLPSADTFSPAAGEP